MKNILLILAIFLATACKEDPPTTTIEGTVINTGSKQPIEGVKVTLIDGGVSSDGIFNNSNTVGTGKSVVKYTDINGKFDISIEGEEPHLFLSKSGYEFEYFRYGSSDNFKPYISGKKYTGEILDLWADAGFKPILKSKNLPFDNDDVWIASLSYRTNIKYDTIGFYEEMYHFHGQGPFTYDDYNLTIGDMYKKFIIKLIRNGITTEHRDSVLVKSFTTYTDTIYY